jgi:hypothetical protein
VTPSKADKRHPGCGVMLRRLVTWSIADPAAAGDSDKATYPAFPTRRRRDLSLSTVPQPDKRLRLRRLAFTRAGPAGASRHG